MRVGLGFTTVTFRSSRIFHSRVFSRPSHCWHGRTEYWKLPAFLPNIKNVVTNLSCWQCLCTLLGPMSLLLQCLMCHGVCCVFVGGSVQWCICMDTDSWAIVWPGAVCLQHCCTLVSVSIRTAALRCVYVRLRWHWFIWTWQCCHAPALLHWASLLWHCSVVLHTRWMYTGISHLSLLLGV